MPLMSGSISAKAKAKRRKGIKASSGSIVAASSLKADLRKTLSGENEPKKA